MNLQTDADMGGADTVLVVPCYNETARFPREGFQAFAEAQPQYAFLFVDDGSDDGTNEMLEEFCREGGARLSCLRIEENVGKGEAVRRGLQAARQRDPAYAGYWDADLSAPLRAAPLLRERLEADPALLVAAGARVLLLGKHIHRRAVRHYVGRAGATLISGLTGLCAYDTQCGAKLLRNGPKLAAALSEPFVSRWLFDVELYLRLLEEGGQLQLASLDRFFYEMPLPCWIDKGGSKVRARDYVRTLLDLIRIRRERGRIR